MKVPARWACQFISVHDPFDREALGATAALMLARNTAKAEGIEAEAFREMVVVAGRLKHAIPPLEAPDLQNWEECVPGRLDTPAWYIRIILQYQREVFI